MTNTLTISYKNDNNIFEIGVDEAGRGALAGPVTVAACIMPYGFQHELIKDSKILKEDERIAIVSSIRIVDRSLVSIDKDKTQCETLTYLANEHLDEYDLFFANGGDQNNDSIPEVPICNKLGINLIEGLGDKIQSSSWLLKK